MKKNKIVFAIQKQGRLKEDSMNYLRSMGLDFGSQQCEMRLKCTNANVEVLFVRDDDIPVYVYRKVADCGIVGANVLAEKSFPLITLRRLNFALCKLFIAVPQNAAFATLEDLNGLRIATSYPKILGEFLAQKAIKASITVLKGAVELAPSLNLADAICDLVQSGKTLRENGLKPLLPIMESEALLVCSTDSQQILNQINFTR